jgi:hypothetical protein
MARTYETPHKSTGGRFPTGQLAPRHQPEVEVEEDPEEVQLEVEVEEDSEEVQPEAEVEEDPEEVQQDHPVEQPRLYDGTVLEADADGDVVILSAPGVAADAPPSPVAPALNAMGGDPDDSGDDSGEDDDETITTMMVKILRRRRMIILAIVGLSTTSTVLRMRMARSVSYWRNYCSIWNSL